MNWNEPTNKPKPEADIVALHNRGKSAVMGVYDDEDGYVACSQDSHQVWWDDVTAWIYAPGEVKAVSLEQRISAIIEAHEKELVEIKRAIAHSLYFNVDYLNGRVYAERGIIKDLKKAIGGMQ